MNYKNEHGQSELALDHLGWKNLAERRAQVLARLMFKVTKNMAPSTLSSLFLYSNSIPSHNLRGSDTSLFLPRPETEYGKKCLSFTRVRIWNHLPDYIRNSETVNSFNASVSSINILV